jgi:hypothetical protein
MVFVGGISFLLGVGDYDAETETADLPGLVHGHVPGPAGGAA